MKRLVFLLIFFPLFAFSQLDLESNRARFNMVPLPALESAMLTPMPNKIDFLDNQSRKLPSFRLSKENFREPVSMAEAMLTAENYVESRIQVSLNAKNYGIYAGNSSYSADGSTKVKNIVYKDASRGFHFPDFYHPAYNHRYSPYRFGHSYY